MSCGVLGIALKNDDTKLKFYASQGLDSLLHRGQNGHGFSFIRSEDNVLELRRKQGLGKNSDIFKDEIRGRFGITHNRYITSSTPNIRNVQPIQLVMPNGVNYAISFNGNINNDKELKNIFGIKQSGISDTVVLARLLEDGLCGNNDPYLFRKNLSMVVGAYSLVALVADRNPRIVAIRDPRGTMPLSLGENGDGFFIASESVSFHKKYLNAKNEKYRELKPGEMIVIDGKEAVSTQLFPPTPQYCTFQWIYMCSPTTTLQGSNVLKVRINLGRMIASRYTPDVDFIAGVPDSGLPVANGYQSVRNDIPMYPAIQRDRHESVRSFMENDQESRTNAVNKKLIVVEEIVKDQRLLIIDDSLVRGTTMRSLVSDLREAGAVEVHVAFAFPQVISQCPNGIDFYNDKLTARKYIFEMKYDYKRTAAAIANEINADSVYYNTIDDLKNVIVDSGNGSMKTADLCISCLNGEYLQKVKFESETERKEIAPSISK